MTNVKIIKRPNVNEDGSPEHERRTAPRLPITAIRALKSVKLLAGEGVRLINISRGGALLESNISMKPGSHISIRLETIEAVYTLRGKVLRSRAMKMEGRHLVFQSAIEFDEQFISLRPSVPAKEAKTLDAGHSSVEDDLAISAESDAAQEIEGGSEDAYTLTASVPDQRVTLSQVLGISAG